MAIRTTAGTDASSSSFESTRSRIVDAASIITRGGLVRGSESASSLPRPTAPEEIVIALDLYASQFMAGQPRSLSGIALRSFALGLILSFSLILTLGLLYFNLPLWRAPFFISTLCFFHFMEFWTTARKNALAAAVSSFLLTSNGAAYNIAHCCALLETTISHLLYPQSLLPSWTTNFRIYLGLFLIVLGQGTRAASILTAGPSFSHIVVHHKRNTHVLIKHGIYSILRHPSYFGFFWWGIGTQLVCGNTLSLIGYAVVLFWFFKTRIKGEETLLVKFFGQEYVDYARQTIVGIPGLG